MHIWWRNKISQLSKVEKGKDLVGVKGGGESNLCIQLPAAWETERERAKEKRRERERECVKADKDGNREREGSRGEDERWMVDTKLSWCVEGNGLSLHWEGHQTDNAWFNWYPDWAPSQRKQTHYTGLQTCGRAADCILMRGLLRVIRQQSPPSACRSRLLSNAPLLPTHTIYLPLTHKAHICNMLLLPDKAVAWRKAVTLLLISPGTF